MKQTTARCGYINCLTRLSPVVGFTLCETSKQGLLFLRQKAQGMEVEIFFYKLATGKVKQIS